MVSGQKVRLCLVQLLVLLSAPVLLSPSSVAVAQDAAASTVKIGASGLRIPRFVSLKSNRVNVRKGPSTDHAVAWVFSKIGLPVEITAESGNWRRIRDSESTEGWVFHSLLSGRRTALIQPWVDNEETVSLYKERSADSGLVARLRSGVLASVVNCNGTWCKVSMDEYSGWIQQNKLWGVYDDESVR